VSLPTLTRKGNLLSSLFLLFTGLTEQVISFAEAVVRVPRTFQIPARFNNAWAFSRKYLRQAMLIATWALFILSSLEWTSSLPSATETTTVQQEASLTSPTNQCQKIIPARSKDHVVAIAHGLTVLPSVYNSPFLPGPRWLLLRNLRI
jgi:hypothetical protein